VLPIASFYLTNSLASKLQIKHDYIDIEFDPRSIGILPPRVMNLLRNISHPDHLEEKFDYEMTLDQNILNAAAIQMG
jgi:hypothetical protein